MKQRVMVRGEQKVTVHGWFMTVNGWEYFLLDNDKRNPIRFCLVDGFEQDMGDVARAEVDPYVMMASADLTDILPANGWSWADGN
jgi:hypothetical protein